MRDTIAVGLIYPFGYCDDTKAGLFHFLEHLIFCNPKSQELMKDFDRKGILYNGVTSYNYTLFYCQGLEDDRKIMLDFLYSLIQNFDISNEQFEREKNIIISEIEYYENNAVEKVSNILKNNFGMISIIGSKSSLEEISMEDIYFSFKSIKNKYNIVDSNGFVYGNNKQTVPRETKLSTKKNNIKLIQSKNILLQNYVGIALETNLTDRIISILDDLFYKELNNYFREELGSTYRINKNITKSKTVTQYQYIFKVSVKTQMPQIFGKIQEIFESTKDKIMNYSEIELNEYESRLDRLRNIRNDSKLGRMKYFALESIVLNESNNSMKYTDLFKNIKLVFCGIRSDLSDITVTNNKIDNYNIEMLTYDD